LIVGLLVSLHQTHLARIAVRTADAQRAIALDQTKLAEAARVSESRQRDEAEQQRLIADQQRVLADVQRDRAQQQTSLADRRVKDILKVADNTLFDVHDAIAKLPGSVAARRTLVQTTLGYLTSLEQDAGLDDEMRLTLCAAYYKVAMIQGDTRGASLQDFQAAETSLLKAQELVSPAYQHHPDDTATILRVIEVRTSLADLAYRSGKRQQAVQSQIDLLPLAHKLLVGANCPIECQIQEATLESALTYESMPMDPAKALAHAKRGAALIQELLSNHVDDPTLEENLGTLMAGEAGAYRALGELENAGQFYRRSIDLREDLLRRGPNDASLRRGLLVAYGNYATLLDIPWSPNLDQADQARGYASKGVTLARAMVAQDAENATARHDLGMILSRLGMIDPTPNGQQASLLDLQEAKSLIEPIAAANAKSSETKQQLAMIMQYEARRLSELGRDEEASAALQRSIEIFLPAGQPHTSSAIFLAVSAEEDLARVYASSAELSKALDLSKKALTELQGADTPSTPSEAHAPQLAEAWATKALIEEKMGLADQARDSAKMALSLWNLMKNPHQLTSYRRQIAAINALTASSGLR